MKSPDKFSEKETERRFRKALQAALSMPPIANKDIRSVRIRAKPKARSTVKRAKHVEDKT